MKEKSKIMDTPVEINQNKNNIILRFSWLVPWIFGWLFTYGYVGFSHDYAAWTIWDKLLEALMSFFLYPIILGWKLSGRVSLLN